MICPPTSKSHFHERGDNVFHFFSLWSGNIFYKKKKISDWLWSAQAFWTPPDRQDSRSHLWCRMWPQRTQPWRGRGGGDWCLIFVVIPSNIFLITFYSVLFLFYFLFVALLIFFFNVVKLSGPWFPGQAWASVVGALSPSLWANRELLSPGNINWSKSSRGPHLGIKIWLHPTAWRLQWKMPQVKQPPRQVQHHPFKKKWSDKKLCYRWRSKVKT